MLSGRVYIRGLSWGFGLFFLSASHSNIALKKGKTIKSQIAEYSTPVVGAAAAPSEPSCATIPTVAQLKATKYYTVINASEAGSLNLTFGGTANLSANASNQVMVLRAARTAECTTDGKYVLLYGSEWVAGTMINQLNFTGAARLAVVAANATTNNSAVSFDSSDQGFQDDTTIRTQSGAVLNDVVTQSRAKGREFCGIPKRSRLR